jgi:hypothetical protein
LLKQTVPVNTQLVIFDINPLSSAVNTELSNMATTNSDESSQDEEIKKISKKTKVKIIFLIIPYIIDLTPLIQFETYIIIPSFFI